MSTPDPSDQAANRRQARNRLALLGLFALFFVPIALAMLLNAMGMRPAPGRAKGELLDPRPDLRMTTLTQLDGRRYEWTPQARLWRIVALAPARCGAACESSAQGIDTVWQLFNKDADRVDVLWLCAAATCEPPAAARRIATLRTLRDAPALRALAPDSSGANAGVPVVVVDPYGFVVLRYPAGFDPADLRSDLGRLLKLR